MAKIIVGTTGSFIRFWMAGSKEDIAERIKGRFTTFDQRPKNEKAAKAAAKGPPVTKQGLPIPPSGKKASTGEPAGAGA